MFLDAIPPVTTQPSPPAQEANPKPPAALNFYAPEDLETEGVNEHKRAQLREEVNYEAI